MNQDSPRQAFAPTRWTLILRARGKTPEAAAALSELCEIYYQSVQRFLMGEGRDEDSARELTQSFFARVLADRQLGEADPERGRFRSYLLGALKHFLADHRKHERRLKRGGGATPESLDSSDSGEEAGLDVAADSGEFAHSFDREWALTVMRRGVEALETEFKQAGKSVQFEAVKPWLMGESSSMSQADAARRLGLTEGAVKVVIHRLRKRFREVIRQEISQTLRDPSLVDEELQHLIEALS